jgi:PhoH-like ATPase
MQPIFDNLAYLLSHRLNSNGDDKAETQKQQMQGIEGRINALLAEGSVVLEPLTYIRGRSIPNQYMVVDEAQNLSPHEVKTIASRVGEGTKLVLTGDATQIDNPYLDSSSNGLSYLVERLKGRGLVGHVTLQRSERSQLASLAAEAL